MGDLRELIEIIGGPSGQSESAGYRGRNYRAVPYIPVNTIYSNVILQRLEV